MWSEKKRDYVGKIPKGGEGSDPNPLHIFLCFFPIQGLIIKAVKNVEIPKLGEGGPPLGNFSHIIPFFFLTAFLSQSTHCPGSVVPLTMCQYDPLLKENGD